MARILAVDDEPHIVRLVQVNLQRRQHTVITACDGVEALEAVAKEHPDLIVMDVMMPRKDGFETLKELKANPDTAEIPVIMLTAKAQDADLMRGYTVGADAYLTKPFNPEELLIFVRRILEQSPLEEGGGKRIVI